MQSMASANSGSSFNVIIPLFDSYNSTSARDQVLLNKATCFEAGVDSLLKPYRVTACESSVDLPALLAKGQRKIRQITSG